MNKDKFIPIAQPLEDEARSVYKTINQDGSVWEKSRRIWEIMLWIFRCKHSIAMNNGTSTLSALLTALEIKKDDEVILPNLTYISSANVVEYHSAKPVLVDNDPETFNVTANNIMEKITDKTKLVMSVDLKGQPVDFDSIIETCNRKKIRYIW